MITLSHSFHVSWPGVQIRHSENIKSNLFLEPCLLSCCMQDAKEKQLLQFTCLNNEHFCEINICLLFSPRYLMIRRTTNTYLKYFVNNNISTPRKSVLNLFKNNLRHKIIIRRHFWSALRHYQNDFVNFLTFLHCKKAL